MERSSDGKLKIKKQIIFGSWGSGREDEESSGELCPIFDHYRKPSNEGNIRLFSKPRKPEPILPVVNPVVSTRNHRFLAIQEISSPSSDSSSDSIPGATYVPPSDLEWQWNYSDREIESPPPDLVGQWDCTNSENEVYANDGWQDISSPSSDSFSGWSRGEMYVRLADSGWQTNYSDIEIESPPPDLVLQRDYSNSEDEVYANAAWPQNPPVPSAIWTESFEDEDSNYIQQLDVIIDAFNSSLSYKKVFDMVDSAVFIEDEKNQLGPSESGEKVEEERVIKCLVAKGKWIKHYNSYHGILLVGEGDFSFSASLAVAFGSASNMIATSLDSVDFLEENYKRAMSNIHELRSRKCIVMHGIDATEVASHRLLGGMTFDRIIFNFPFAGFFKDLPREAQIRKHRRLVNLFLQNAKEMIGENGEIHITHKTNGFHKEWMLETMASFHRLRLIEAVEFDLSDYEGYNTKCGFGGDNNFNCYPSKTYKFGL
ncbi:uncharacterized protein LOC111395806 [Olea europaea var. sylvestris]|uniref:uncharacterized protein LOC111395806 n=1 Tax=Olea europaea var. sylvestris TaxID=158386 RepID=UPI000C1D3A73|nr:uncharacterized protein LOC111395806 [Olea europaea var. sylvestris]